jgi:hypothetical protein
MIKNGVIKIADKVKKNLKNVFNKMKMIVKLFVYFIEI